MPCRPDWWIGLERNSCRVHSKSSAAPGLLSCSMLRARDHFLVPLTRPYVLDEPFVGETKVAVVADHDVIQEGEFHQLTGLLQVFRHATVFTAGLGVARRVVVNRNYSCRP